MTCSILWKALYARQFKSWILGKTRYGGYFFWG